MCVCEAPSSSSCSRLSWACVLLSTTSSQLVVFEASNC